VFWFAMALYLWCLSVWRFVRVVGLGSFVVEAGGVG